MPPTSSVSLSRRRQSQETVDFASSDVRQIRAETLSLLRRLHRVRPLLEAASSGAETQVDCHAEAQLLADAAAKLEGVCAHLPEATNLRRWAQAPATAAAVLTKRFLEGGEFDAAL